MRPMIEADTARPFTRLLHVLVEGERIAGDCARWQSTVTSEPRARRFFHSQTRHEGFHGRLFQGAALWLAPHVSAAQSRSPGLESYRRRLESAMSHGRWTEVLVGQQIVLEELGEVVLARLDAEIGRRGLPFRGVSRLVLRQEHAHHTFGLRLIDAELQARRVDAAALQILAEEYLDLADRFLLELAPLLESLDADADDYRRELRRRLPHWMGGSVQ